MARTAYTPWVTVGGKTPTMGDSVLAGWHDGDDIAIELTVGANADLGAGPLEFGLPFRVDSINAPVVLLDASAKQRHEGHVVLRDDEPASSVVITREMPIPRGAPDEMLWSPGWPIELAVGDTLRIRGKMAGSPAGCPDCHVPVDAPHTEGCAVALCSTCGLLAGRCPHAGQRRAATLWKGRLPDPAADGLRWNRRRARWEEHPPPPPDLEVDDYGFNVAAVTRPEWDPAEPARYVVQLPPQPAEPYGPGWTVAWCEDRAQAEADLARFIAQAQAALARLRDLP